MMITSGASQYLHPDYLQPLPTTLDAKKSPLALLAQTCSSIGKDTSPGKNIIPPLEKKEEKKKEQHNGKTESPQRTASPQEERRTPGRDSVKRDAASPREEKRSSKDLPALVPISSSSSSTSSQNDKGTPPPTSEKDSKGPERDSSSAPATSHNNSASNNSSSSNSRISLSCGNMLLEVNHHESSSSSSSVASSSAAKTTTTSSTSTTPAVPKPGEYHHASALHGHLGASYPGCALPLLGHHIPVDTATATPIHPAAISVHSSMGLSAAQKGLPSAHGLSPYTYARVKSASGASTLVPICRDPYCTNCQLTMQNAQFTSTCAAGCTQCNHEKTLPTSLAGSFGSALGTVPVLPLGASALTPSASALASSYYSHAFSMLPGSHHTLPYVCNWMAGSDYCGKRFTTSEELLQHLRTHTSSADSAALASLYPGLGLSAAAVHASLAAGGHTAPPHYPPGSLSPNSLRQAYPRSLSPNSLLAAARYHPYKSPLSLPTTLASAAGLPSAALPAGLAPYYSSYALYGQRLGAAAP